MRSLNVDYPSPEGVEGGLAPGSPGAPPPDLAVPGAAVKPEPVTADVDSHLPLFAEAVGGETVQSSADEADCNKKKNSQI